MKSVSAGDGICEGYCGYDSDASSCSAGCDCAAKTSKMKESMVADEIEYYEDEYYEATIDSRYAFYECFQGGCSAKDGKCGKCRVSSVLNSAKRT